MARRRREARAKEAGPGFRREATGFGYGCLIVLAAGLLLGPMWFGLSRLEIGVPTPGELMTTGPPDGSGWLIVSTLVAVPVCVAPLPLMFLSAMSFDAAGSSRVPRRTYLVGLYIVLPVLGLIMIVAGWISYAAHSLDTARYLALGPWAAGLGVIAVAAVLYSAAVAYEQ